MKPMIILSPNTMSEADIAELRKNDICVVVAKNPMNVKFVDPIPAVSSRTKMEDAAIQLSRIVLNGAWGDFTTNNYIQKGDAARIYIDCLTKGTALDRSGSQQEQEARFFNEEKRLELARLAKAEAKAEREAAKKAEAAKTEAK